MGDEIDREYTETRYYKIGETGASNQGYDDLVKLNTEYNVPGGGQGTSNVSYINSNLYNYFNYDRFKQECLESNNLIITKIDAPVTLSTFINQLKDDNSNLLDYYTGLDGMITDSNEYILDNHVKNLAVKVTDYFVVSTALYELLYTESEEGRTTTDGIKVYYNWSDPASTTRKAIEYNGFVAEAFADLRDDEDVTTTASKQNAIIKYLYPLYIEAIEALKLNDSDAEKKYSKYLHDNITLNNMFLTQQQQLDANQDVFDTKKALVITMMAKAHKANKLYSKKKLWFTIYLSMLIVYLLTVVGVIYAASSSNEMFNMFQNAMVGLVIVVSSAFILIALFIYEISKYFYK